MERSFLLKKKKRCGKSRNCSLRKPTLVSYMRHLVFATQLEANWFETQTWPRMYQCFTSGTLKNQRDLSEEELGACTRILVSDSFFLMVHNILSKPLAPFRSNYRRNNGQRSERNESCRNIKPWKEYWPSRGSNKRPPVLKSATLPTALWGSAVGN